MGAIGTWLLAAVTTLSAVAFSRQVGRTRGKPMRATLSWLLAAVTILFSVIMTRPVGQSSLLLKMPDILQDLEWFDSAVGVAVGVAVVLVAMAAGVARGSRHVVLRDGRELPKAGIAARLAARIADLLVVAPGLFVVLRYLGRALDAAFSCFISVSYCVPDPHPPFGPAEMVAFAWVVLYEPVSVALWGRTAGKWAEGIKVVSIVDGAKPSMARSFARVALPAVAGLATFGVGWLVVQTVLWASTMADSDRRGWHDRLAATVVVKAKRRPARSDRSDSDDILHDGSGGDNLDGNADGDDTLDGGNGSDHLDGGPDTDDCIRGDTIAGCETESRSP